MVTTVRSLLSPQCGGVLRPMCGPESVRELSMCSHLSPTTASSTRQTFQTTACCAECKSAQLTRSRLPKAMQAVSGKGTLLASLRGSGLDSIVIDSGARYSALSEDTCTRTGNQAGKQDHIPDSVRRPTSAFRVKVSYWNSSHTGQQGIHFEDTNVCGTVASVSSLMLDPAQDAQREKVTALAIVRRHRTVLGSTCSEPMNHVKQMQ